MSWTGEELAALIARGEGKELEFKRGLPRDEKAARTLTAFANTRGGVLLVGVGDRGELLGAPHPARTAQRLREIATHGVEPPLRVEVELVKLAERTLVVCSVPVSPARPHSVLRAGGDPETVVRSGSSNRAAEGATLRALREQRTSKRSLTELERRVLDWVRQVSGNGTAAQSRATLATFCAAQNIGKQRARRAFIDLERHGYLIGQGSPARRSYSPA